MSIQPSGMTWYARIGEASGSHAVPEPILVIGMPNGRASIAMPGIVAVSECSGS
jgi:hypothetical protein